MTLWTILPVALLDADGGAGYSVSKKDGARKEKLIGVTDHQRLHSVLIDIAEHLRTWDRVATPEGTSYLLPARGLPRN